MLHRRLLVLPLAFMAFACGPSPAGPSDTGALDAATVTDAPLETAPDAPAPPVDAGPMPITVMTDKGLVTGRDRGASAEFLGVPFAAPPIGSLRWRPPVDHTPWTAPLDASQFGPVCPQTAGALSMQPPAYSEDCLTLNVWTPSHAPGTSTLPVMVFIHGGGFTSGSGSDAQYVGHNLAERGHVVVVTINYRLGQLGFLAHPALESEDPAHHSAGNYGLLDQQAALRWVQTNAAAFGGDARNVTLFGESAGSISVCEQIVSPPAAGLFRRTINESGSCFLDQTPLHDTPGNTNESADALGHRFAQALGCDSVSDPAACMRAHPVADVLAAVPTALELTTVHARFQPNIDGYVLPDPIAALSTGSVNHVTTLSGTNRDEGSFFTATAPLTTQQQYSDAVAAIAPTHVNDVMRLYPTASYASVNDAYVAFLSDIVFICPARAQARFMAAVDPHAYLYHFTHLTNFGRSSGLGVYHTAELAFVFRNFVAPVQASSLEYAVSDTVMGYWTRFAATGDPNGAGAVAWPAFTRSGDAYLDLSEATMARTNLHQANCDAMSGWIAGVM